MVSFVAVEGALTEPASGRGKAGEWSPEEQEGTRQEAWAGEAQSMEEADPKHRRLASAGAHGADTGHLREMPDRAAGPEGPEEKIGGAELGGHDASREGCSLARSSGSGSHGLSLRHYIQFSPGVSSYTLGKLIPIPGKSLLECDFCYASKIPYLVKIKKNVEFLLLSQGCQLLSFPGRILILLPLQSPCTSTHKLGVASRMTSGTCPLCEPPSRCPASSPVTSDHYPLPTIAAHPVDAKKGAKGSKIHRTPIRCQAYGYFMDNFTTVLGRWPASSPFYQCGN